LLEYTLKQRGQVSISVLQQIVRSGREIPPELQGAPDLPIGLHLYWGAFWDLASCRLFDGGMIPWTAVQLWADTYELEHDAAETLHYHIRRLDDVFVKHYRKKADGDHGDGERIIGRRNVGARQ
jgi:hypothetical protein